MALARRGRLHGCLNDYYREPQVETVVDYRMVLAFWYDQFDDGERGSPSIDEFGSVAFGQN